MIFNVEMLGDDEREWYDQPERDRRCKPTTEWVREHEAGSHDKIVQRKRNAESKSDEQRRADDATLSRAWITGFKWPPNVWCVCVVFTRPCRAAKNPVDDHRGCEHEKNGCEQFEDEQCPHMTKEL